MSSTISEDFNPKLSYPAYFVRKRLLTGIRKYSHHLTGTMLDFGCGSKPYKSLFNVTNYVGLDFENPGHSHQNEQIDIFYDGKHIPAADNYFDSAFSSEVFEHVFNLPEMLPEIYRVLKPGAPILVTCPFAICEHEAPNDYARYSSFALKHMMEKNGFEVLAYEKLGNSIEVIFQLLSIYIQFHITPHLKKIPLLGSAFQWITCSFLNVVAIGLGKIFPKGDELYLNNIIVCKKV